MTTQNCRATIPERFLDLLESRVLAHVATIGPSDEPQSNPVWFGWDGYLEVRGVVDRIEEDPDLDLCAPNTRPRRTVDPVGAA